MNNKNGLTDSVLISKLNHRVRTANECRMFKSTRYADEVQTDDRDINTKKNVCTLTVTNENKKSSGCHSNTLKKAVDRYFDEFRKNKVCSSSLDLGKGVDTTSIVHMSLKAKRNSRDDFRLLYANIREIMLQMEEVLKTNEVVDYEYQCERFKKWINQISK